MRGRHSSWSPEHRLSGAAEEESVAEPGLSSFVGWTQSSWRGSVLGRWTMEPDAEESVGSSLSSRRLVALGC